MLLRVSVASPKLRSYTWEPIAYCAWQVPQPSCPHHHFLPNPVATKSSTADPPMTVFQARDGQVFDASILIFTHTNPIQYSSADTSRGEHGCPLAHHAFTCLSPLLRDPLKFQQWGACHKHTRGFPQCRSLALARRRKDMPVPM